MYIPTLFEKKLQQQVTVVYVYFWKDHSKPNKNIV